MNRQHFYEINLGMRLNICYTGGQWSKKVVKLGLFWRYFQLKFVAPLSCYFRHTNFEFYMGQLGRYFRLENFAFYNVSNEMSFSTYKFWILTGVNGTLFSTWEFGALQCNYNLHWVIIFDSLCMNMVQLGCYLRHEIFPLYDEPIETLFST